jgi:hypothetical protein
MDTGEVDLRPLMLREGCRVEASGRVIAVEGQVWFEPPLPVRLVGYAPGHEPAPTWSGLGIPVRGTDLGRLDRRRLKDGALEGWAQLIGHWTGGELVVAEQDSPSWPEQPGPRWHAPPCEPPEGGWPHVRRDENIEPPPDLEGDPAVVGVMMARPSPTQVVLVLVSTEPDWTREQLGARYPYRSCVVASRWTRAQIDGARSHLETRMGAGPGSWQIYQTGQSHGEDCQIRFEVEAVQVVSEFAQWASTVPDGLLQVRVWLAPTPATAPATGTATAHAPSPAPPTP